MEDVAGIADVWQPNLYLYDAYSGGVGLSAPLYRMTPLLLARTRELIEACTCDAGCPACVGPPGGVGERGKEVALAVLRALHAGNSEIARMSS
jgi:DEAD/DEAH box helicase domain-containing protein